MKTLKRTLLIFLAIAIITPIGLYYWIKLSVDKIATPQQLEEIVATIKAAEPLPEDFYTLFETVYPGSLEHSTIVLLLQSAYRKDYPFILSRMALRFRALSNKQITKQGFFNVYSLAFNIDGKVNNRQYLNHIMANYDFCNNNRNIEQACQSYFGKPLKHLDRRQMLSIIVMVDNPSRYNPKRRPELLNKKVNEIIAQIDNRNKE